jgi:predicted PurR-regulated permease PerM
MTTSKSQPIVFLLVGLASVFVIGWGVKASAFILNPILLAAVITVVVLPMPQSLTKRGLPSWLSFVLTLLLVVGGLALVVLFVFFSFTSIANDFSSQMASGDLLSSLNPAIVTFVSTMVSALGKGLVQLFMVMLIFIFMLSGAVASSGSNRLGEGTASAMTQTAKLTQDVRRYMSIMTAVNFMVALGDMVFLWILGVPYAIVWGLLSWLMGYIPSVGFWVALIPPVLVAYSTLGVQTAVIVFVGYVLINGSVQNFLQPKMMGQGLGISPLVVFVSLFVWAWLLGGIGAILAVPLTMIIIAVLHNFDNTRWIATLMSTPTSDKNEDQKKAQGKLQGFWHRTRNSVQENFGKDGKSENVSNPNTMEPELTDTLTEGTPMVNTDQPT